MCLDLLKHSSASLNLCSCNRFFFDMFLSKMSVVGSKTVGARLSLPWCFFIPTDWFEEIIQYNTK